MEGRKDYAKYFMAEHKMACANPNCSYHSIITATYLACSISLILPNEVIYETIMTAIMLPIFFLSSALFPLENLSGGLKVAVMLNPFTHIINALRDLIFGQMILFKDILPVIALLSMMCCGSFALAIWRLKKETAS